MTKIEDNANNILKLLPTSWMHVDNFELLPFCFQLKLFGIDWRSIDDLARIMTYIETIGLLERDGDLIRGNKDFV